jgi:hypothetical protein
LTGSDVTLLCAPLIVNETVAAFAFVATPKAASATAAVIILRTDPIAHSQFFACSVPTLPAHNA